MSKKKPTLRCGVCGASYNNVEDYVAKFCPKCGAPFLKVKLSKEEITKLIIHLVNIFEKK